MTPAPTPPARPYSTLALTAVTGVSVGCAASACAAGVGLFALFGEANLGQVALLAAVAFVVVTGHMATVMWAVRSRPELREVAITQAPFVVTYALAIPWYVTRRFPLPVFGWVAVALSALAWLVVWFLRDPSRPRRAIAFLAALAGLVAANGLGVLAVSWNTSNGFGLRGEPAPWTAFNNLVAASCIGDIDSRSTGGRVVRSDCPDGPGADYYAGHYDRKAFDDLLCDEQPRAAFQVWLDRQRDYGYDITLSFQGDWQVVVDGATVRPPYPQKLGGQVATLTMPMRLSATFFERDVKKRFQVDKSAEMWRVELRTVALGGWKVCRIDILDPIRVTDL